MAEDNFFPEVEEDDPFAGLEAKYGFTKNDMDICCKVMNCLRAADDWVENPLLKSLRTGGLCVESRISYLTLAECLFVHLETNSSSDKTQTITIRNGIGGCKFC